VIDDDVPARITELKHRTDGGILVAGSRTLVRTLVASDLVDELRLMVFPTVLGRGKRLFPDGIDRLTFRLAEYRAVGPDGVVIRIHQRA
jgi:dihydrofolate reductase